MIYSIMAPNGAMKHIPTFHMMTLWISLYIHLVWNFGRHFESKNIKFLVLWYNKKSFTLELGGLHIILLAS